jgi:hypothetical protein
VLSDGLRELGSLYTIEGDLTAAMSLIEEALAEARAIGSIMQVFVAMREVVIISCLQNEPVKAKGYCSELWALGKEMGSPFALIFALLSFGFAECFGGQPQRGARLLAATEVMVAQRGIKLGEHDPIMIVFRQALEKSRTQLGPAAFQAALAEGQQMTMEQAVALITEIERDQSQPPKGRI